MIIYESRKHRRNIHLLNTKEGFSPGKREPEHNPSEIEITQDKSTRREPLELAARKVACPVTQGEGGGVHVLPPCVCVHARVCTCVWLCFGATVNLPLSSMRGRILCAEMSQKQL